MDNPSAGFDFAVSVITVIFVVLFFVLFITVKGVVTRYRINYTPKGIGLRDEQVLGQDMRVGPAVNSVRTRNTQAPTRSGSPNRRQAPLTYSSPCRSGRCSGV